MAVIKYYVDFIGMRSAVYEEIHSPERVGTKLSKERAMEIIDSKGLVRVLKNQYGSVWDTPEKSFYHEFKGAKVKR